VGQLVREAPVSRSPRSDRPDDGQTTDEIGRMMVWRRGRHPAFKIFADAVTER
jgi:hypothetical protein